MSTGNISRSPTGTPAVPCAMGASSRSCNPRGPATIGWRGSRNSCAAPWGESVEEDYLVIELAHRRISTDVARGAWPVIDDEGFAKPFRQRLTARATWLGCRTS